MGALYPTLCRHAGYLPLTCVPALVEAYGNRGHGGSSSSSDSRLYSSDALLHVVRMVRTSLAY